MIPLKSIYKLDVFVKNYVPRTNAIHTLAILNLTFSSIAMANVIILLVNGQGQEVISSNIFENLFSLRNYL